MQWSINALRNELDVAASDRRQRILIGESPYARFDAGADPTPCEEELIRANCHSLWRRRIFTQAHGQGAALATCASIRAKG